MLHLQGEALQCKNLLFAVSKFLGLVSLLPIAYPSAGT